MPETVHVGTILVKGSLQMPELFALEVERYSGNWKPGQDARWLRAGSQDSRRGMELLFHGDQSKGDVLWCARSEENPECSEANFRKGEAATLQCP